MQVTLPAQTRYIQINMRIHLQLTPNHEPVPFTYQQNLVGAFHKWLGKNLLHDATSLYSFSWLKGGTMEKGALQFSKGATWFISTFQDEIAKKLLKGLLDDPHIAFGLKVREVSIQDSPVFKESERFLVASPVLVREKFTDGVKFIYHDSPIATQILTGSLKTKLRKGGLPDHGVEAEFDTTYPMATVKASTYNGITNKGSLCPVIIRGTPEQVAFAWNVGVGHSTGIGFGALM